MRQCILKRYCLITFLNLKAFKIKIPTLLTAVVDITLNFKSLNLFTKYMLSKDLLPILKVAISWRNLKILFSPSQNLTLKTLVLKLFQLIQFHLPHQSDYLIQLIHFSIQSLIKWLLAKSLQINTLMPYRSYYKKHIINLIKRRRRKRRKRKIYLKQVIKKLYS